MRSVGLLAIAMLFLCGNASAERTVWYVHPDSALNTIQAGLDSCADNDIVLVGPGTYYENIVWPNTQGIHLVSELGSDLTIIDGDSTNRVIEISTWVDTTSVIRGFTIRNGLDTLGAGIYCGAYSSPIITHNNITNNIAGVVDPLTGGGVGAGIYCDSGSAPAIISNNITNNIARGVEARGGGIVCSYSTPTIANNIITNNKAQAWFCATGGGISCVHSSPVISGNTITYNIAAAGGECYGSGIYCSHSSPLITGNGFSDNGICCGSSSSPVIDSCTLENSGLSLLNNSSPFISNCTITNHGVYCQFDCSPTIENCVITTNGNEPGISCTYGCNAVIQHCDIFECDPGILCLWDNNVTVHYCNIYNNLGYGICREQSSIIINAINNWWGDATGPYHPTANPGGLGDAVSDYVDFDPWLTGPGVAEQPIVKPVETRQTLAATIFRGPLQLPEGKKCIVIDITGRVVEPDKIQPGIYFIEVEGVVTQKVVKVR